MKVAKSKDEDDNEGVDEGGGEGGDVGVDEDDGGELIDFKLLRGFSDRLTNECRVAFVTEKAKLYNKIEIVLSNHCKATKWTQWKHHGWSNSKCKGYKSAKLSF